MQGGRKRIVSISSQTNTRQLDMTSRSPKDQVEQVRETRSPSPTSRHTMRMRVMTYDVWNGGLPATDDMEDRLEKIVSVVRKLRPDVLCLQEAT